jgi:UDPglucose 6-dehydrogenase
MRDAPAIDIVRHLMKEGATVRAYDPVAMDNAARILPDIEMCHDAYEVAEGADALLLVTEWNEFKHLDLAKIKQLMKTPILVDGRNVYDPGMVSTQGFTYRGMGRGYDGSGVGKK